MKALVNYETASEAINDLIKRGYTTDFEVLTDQEWLVCKKTSERLSPDEFEIDETYRFEGDSDPGDEMIVFAISAKRHQMKGLVVNAFGPYADASAYKIVSLLMNKATISKQPIKRHEFLKPLSREHHHGLLLCWKIRNGLKKEIAPERIKKYADWFWEIHLKRHFEMEEKYIFPILGSDHELIQKALSEHQSITNAITNSTDLNQNLAFIADTLERHIRFEERVLFHQIQLAATEAQLEQYHRMHNEIAFADNMDDPFWE